MPNQSETIHHLHKEKEYEDKLASDLFTYFLDCLDGIKDITEEEKSQIDVGLSHIRKESENHSYLFNQLLQWVFENGEDNY